MLRYSKELLLITFNIHSLRKKVSIYNYLQLFLQDDLILVEQSVVSEELSFLIFEFFSQDRFSLDILILWNSYHLGLVDQLLSRHSLS